MYQLIIFDMSIFETNKFDISLITELKVLNLHQSYGILKRNFIQINIEHAVVCIRLLTLCAGLTKDVSTILYTYSLKR